MSLKEYEKLRNHYMKYNNKTSTSNSISNVPKSTHNILYDKSYDLHQHTNSNVDVKHIKPLLDDIKPKTNLLKTKTLNVINANNNLLGLNQLFSQNIINEINPSHIINENLFKNRRCSDLRKNSNNKNTNNNLYNINIDNSTNSQFKEVHHPILPNNIYSNIRVKKFNEPNFRTRRKKM